MITINQTYYFGIGRTRPEKGRDAKQVYNSHGKETRGNEENITFLTQSEVSFKKF